MPKITLKLPSWIATVIEANSSGWLTFEKQISEGTTINDVLQDFVTTYPDFRRAAYNPDAGLATEQLNFILNDRLLTFQEMLLTRLNDYDTVVLIPLYSGG
jgi:molybdopterin converting factor small subunit